MSITLEMLQAAATGTATRAASRAFHTLSVADARAEVKIKDGNRKPAEDGSMKLTIVIGKHTLPMDCIKAGTSRVAVEKDQVEGYTEALQGLSTTVHSMQHCLNESKETKTTIKTCVYT